VAAFEVLPSNERTTDLFMLLQTQWKYDRVGKPDGIDYKAVEAAANMMRIQEEDRPELFSGIQIMEFAALEVFSG